MKYIECPTDYLCAGRDIAVFLAGGISNCPDWQQEIVARLSDSQLTLVNPRRKIFTEEYAEEQIKWEHCHLTRCDAVLFWFTCETICPIALYELGAWNFRPKKLFVGCHPNYQRKLDVEVQTRLERPNTVIAYSIQDLVQQVLDWSVKKVANHFHRDNDQPEARNYV